MDKSPNPAKPTGSKARRYKRFGFDRRVVVLRNDDTQTQLRGRCDTISEGGIGVMLAGELQLGEQVNVEVALDGETPLVLAAEVRDRKGFHHGLAFRMVTAVQRKALTKAVLASSAALPKQP
jgi:c-di-GMP-binding flagellar brake protein YcgR